MKYLFAVPFVAALIGGVWAFFAWLVMLAVGIVHHDWLHAVPTIGYHAAFPLSWALGVLAGSSALGAGVASAMQNRK